MSSSSWQPIATAPKDGTFILAYWSEEEYPHEFVSRHDVVEWMGGCWCMSDGDDVIDPTHWMPLPPAPEVT